MSNFRNRLPQLSDELFLMDAGLETDLIFNHGIEIPEFAAHTLLQSEDKKEVMTRYFQGFLALAGDLDVGFILNSQTAKAHLHWADILSVSEQDLQQANRDSIAFIAQLRDEFSGNQKPIVLNGIICPMGNAYARGTGPTAAEARQYHARQISWLAETEVDMVSAVTFPRSDEAIGVVQAAVSTGLPVSVSFTVEMDGRLPSGQSLQDAIYAVDHATDAATAYYLVNCAHPDHFFDVLDDSDWSRRIRGLRCNASRLSHVELDQCEVLDSGDPAELADQYKAISKAMPWLNIFGACCGTDLRHVTHIAHAVMSSSPAPDVGGGKSR